MTGQTPKTGSNPEVDAGSGREPASMSVHGAAIWAMAGQYLSFAIQFVTSVIISRFFLTPAEVGLFSVALSAALVASVLQDFGLTRYIAGLAHIAPDSLARCSSVALLFSLIITGIIAGAARPMAHAYHQPALLPMLLIIASSYLFLPLSVVPLALNSEGSVHIVFRKPATATALTVAKPAAVNSNAIKGPWKVSFQAGRGAPASIMLPKPMKTGDSPSSRNVWSGVGRGRSDGGLASLMKPVTTWLRAQSCGRLQMEGLTASKFKRLLAHASVIVSRTGANPSRFRWPLYRGRNMRLTMLRASRQPQRCDQAPRSGNPGACRVSVGTQLCTIASVAAGLPARSAAI